MSQLEPDSILYLTFPKVAQAMWWVAKRRLCGGFCENNANLSPTKFALELRLSLAIFTLKILQLASKPTGQLVPRCRNNTSSGSGGVMSFSHKPQQLH